MGLVSLQAGKFAREQTGEGDPDPLGDVLHDGNRRGAHRVQRGETSRSRSVGVKRGRGKGRQPRIRNGWCRGSTPERLRLEARAVAPTDRGTGRRGRGRRRGNWRRQHRSSSHRTGGEAGRPTHRANRSRRPQGRRGRFCNAGRAARRKAGGATWTIGIGRILALEGVLTRSSAYRQQIRRICGATNGYNGNTRHRAPKNDWAQVSQESRKTETSQSRVTRSSRRSRSLDHNGNPLRAAGTAACASRVARRLRTPRL